MWKDKISDVCFASYSFQNQLNTNLFFVSPELDFVLIGHNIKDVSI